MGRREERSPRPAASVCFDLILFMGNTVYSYLEGDLRALMLKFMVIRGLRSLVLSSDVFMVYLDCQRGEIIDILSRYYVTRLTQNGFLLKH